MSLDRSLKGANALVRHRNVLTRAERLERLKEEEKWNDSKAVLGLPKVGNRKMEVGGKAEKEDAAAAGAAGTPAAGAAAPAAAAAAPGAKGAAGGGKPAAGAPAKGAAPAAPAAKKK